MRQPDPITLRRVRKVLSAARPLLVGGITTAWLARTLARVDGGPILDAPRLGPALRTLGFRSARRRRGASRVSVWLRPGPASPRLGRPPQCSHLSGQVEWNSAHTDDELRIERVAQQKLAQEQALDDQYYFDGLDAQDMAKHKYGSAERERELERKPSHPPAN